MIGNLRVMTRAYVEVLTVLVGAARDGGINAVDLED